MERKELVDLLERHEAATKGKRWEIDEDGWIKNACDYHSCGSHSARWEDGARELAIDSVNILPDLIRKLLSSGVV